MGKNYIPNSDMAFHGWQDVLVAGVVANATAWNIPATEVVDLQTLQIRWKTAYAMASHPATRTKGSVKEKQEARKAYEEGIRRLARIYLTYNPAISDQEREDIGLPVHKTSHTPVPAPTTLVESQVVLPGPATVEIHFHDASSAGKAKPAGVHGAEIAWAVLDTPPEDWGALTHSSFDTHTPFRLSFPGNDRGKTLYFALRWENTTGEKGLWGDIQSAIIP